MTRATSRRTRWKRAGGFMLLEALLAVTIFAIGVLTLGRCVSGCLSAVRLKEQDALARRALENRWAEIESGAVQLTNENTEELKPPFEGMTLKTTRVAVEKRNEKDEKIEGIYAVTLSLAWPSDGEEQTKELLFYLYPRQSGGYSPANAVPRN